MRVASQRKIMTHQKSARQYQKNHVKLENGDKLRRRLSQHLCYGRAYRANTLQAQMGCFLRASKTPKRVIMVLHQIGISVSYKSITKGMTGLAESAAEELHKFCAAKPRFFISFDNMNIFARVRDQRLHNQSELLNYTAGYVAANRKSIEEQMFTSSAIDRSKFATLKSSDFLPDKDEENYQKYAFRAGIYEGLSKYFREALSKYLHKNKPLKPWHYPILHQLLDIATIVFTLPAYDKNEAKIEEITQILYKIATELGYTNEQLLDFLIMYKGDFLTARNMRYATCRSELMNIE